MDPITKARCLKCSPGPIDPYEPFQPEISATWVTLEDENMPLNPPQTWGFQAKKTLSSDHFRPVEHLAWTPSPNLDICHVPLDPSFHTNHPNQKLRIIPTRNYSHLSDIGGQERDAQPPSDMGISGQKGPPPATVLDPLRIWNDPYHSC